MVADGTHHRNRGDNAMVPTERPYDNLYCQRNSICFPIIFHFHICVVDTTIAMQITIMPTYHVMDVYYSNMHMHVFALHVL